LYAQPDGSCSRSECRVAHRLTSRHNTEPVRALRTRGYETGSPVQHSSKLQELSPHLTVDLIDGIAEAVASPPDPHTRSAAICSLVREIYETMEWLHGTDTHHEELASLRQVVAAAQSHQQRMSALRDVSGSAGPSAAS
jgi:hypothetical protein